MVGETFAILTAAASLSGWHYLPSAPDLPGGGPAAVRAAGAGEPAIIACERRTGVVVIGSGPSAARGARLSGLGGTQRVRARRGSDGALFLPVLPDASLLIGLSSGSRGVDVRYDDGRRFRIVPDEAVTRVVRECGSLAAWR